MYNNKFNWILTALIAASVFFYACPTEEEEPPESPPDLQAQANQAMTTAKSVLGAAKSDGGTFTNNTSAGNSPHNVKFVLSYSSATLPENTQIDITNVKLGGDSFTKSQTVSIGENKTSTSIQWTLDDFIEKIDANWNGDIEFYYIAKSTKDSTIKSAESGTLTITDTGSVSGTLTALKGVVKHFPTKGGGTIINSGGGSVDTLNASGVGTLFSTVTGNTPIVLPVADANVPFVSVWNSVSNVTGSFAAGSIGTLAELHGGFAMTEGSEAVGAISAGSFMILLDNGGTLMVEDKGSASAGSALATVYFGTSSTKTEKDNLVLSAGGIKYIVPQFGVLVTIDR
jgi:hypothetical protein